MLNHQELAGLCRELRHEWVLSVYLNRGFVDLSQRNLWRCGLELAVSEDLGVGRASGSRGGEHASHEPKLHCHESRL
jgi:hypothetical protein